MAASEPTSKNEEKIAAIAYELWLSEGRSEGRDKEHWFRAVEIVGEGSDGAASGTGDDYGETPGGDPAHVRPAGPEEMDLAPKTWTKTDEENDESFPASDPPGNY